VILTWVYWLKGMRPGDEKAATVKAEKAPEKAAEAVPETPPEKPPEESANQAS
jgi:hypothetical protein